MKKNHLKLITLLCGICLLIFACRKDLKSLLGDQPAPETAVLTSAKSWQLNEVRKFPAKLKKTTLQPRWTQAWTMKTSDGKSIMVVPTREVRIDGKSGSFRRFYVFDLDGINITSGKIVELLGYNDYDVSDHLTELLTNLHSKSIAGFNGAILEYNVNYRRRGGVAYENGVRTDKAVAIARGNNMRFEGSTYSNASTGGRPLKVNDMWFLGTYVRDECSYLITTNSSGQIISCTLYSCPEPATETASTASATDPGTLPGGELPEVIIHASGGSAQGRPINITLLKLRFLCVANMVNYMTQTNGFYRVITSPFTETSYLNTPPTLNFNASDAAHTLQWVDSQGNGKADLGSTNYDVGTNEWKILLNENLLTNGSALMIYATILHESMHAYIRYSVNAVENGLANGNTWMGMEKWIDIMGLPAGYSNHLEMLDDSFSNMMETLKELDGGHHTQKEYAMAMLYGLNKEGADADQIAQLDDFYNARMTQYSITPTEANNFYKNMINLPANSTETKLPAMTGCPALPQN